MRRECFVNLLRIMISDNVYIEITNRCNLNCRDCYNSSGRNTSTVELSPSVIMQFIKLLRANCGLKSVTISGGEPLMHSDFDTILGLLSDFSNENPDMEFNFITNGILYNPMFYELLKLRSNFFVQISLDGPNELANSSMRGEGNFNRVMTNISGRSFANKPTFKMIINRANASFIDEYFYFVTDVLGGRPAFAFANFQGNAVDNWSDLTLTDKEQADIIVSLYKLYLKRYGKDYADGKNLPLPAVTCDLTKPDGVRNFCVKSDGSIQPCQNFYSSDFTLGNINFLEWDDVVSKIDILTASLSKRLSMDYGCSRCPLKGKCGHGCPAMSFLHYEDLLRDDTSCNIRKLATFKILKASK